MEFSHVGNELYPVDVTNFQLNQTYFSILLIRFMIPTA
jgi:hypothetical protein